MKIKTAIALAAASIAGLTAQAQDTVVVGKQIMNIVGRAYVDSGNANSVSTVLANQRVFIEIIAEDEGLELDARELRTSRLVTFDFGDGLEGLFIEFWDAALRDYVFYDVSDRIGFFFLSDVAGNDETSGGRWAANIEILIDLIDEDDAFVEFAGNGIFQGAVRTLRGAGDSIQIPTAGLRSRGFPAVLFLALFDEDEFVPAALTIALRTQVDRVSVELVDDEA